MDDTRTPAPSPLPPPGPPRIGALPGWLLVALAATGILLVILAAMAIAARGARGARALELAPLAPGRRPARRGRARAARVAARSAPGGPARQRARPRLGARGFGRAIHPRAPGARRDGRPGIRDGRRRDGPRGPRSLDLGRLRRRQPGARRAGAHDDRGTASRHRPFGRRGVRRADARDRRAPARGIGDRRREPSCWSWTPARPSATSSRGPTRPRTSASSSWSRKRAGSSSSRPSGGASPGRPSACPRRTGRRSPRRRWPDRAARASSPTAGAIACSPPRRRIPEIGWAIVVEVDRGEALAELGRRKLWILGAAAGLLAAILGARFRLEPRGAGPALPADLRARRALPGPARADAGGGRRGRRRARRLREPGVRRHVRVQAAAHRRARHDLLRARLARAGRGDRGAPQRRPSHAGALRGPGPARRRHDVRGRAAGHARRVRGQRRRPRRSCATSPAASAWRPRSANPRSATACSSSATSPASTARRRTGRLLECNRAFAKMMGFASPAEAMATARHRVPHRPQGARRVPRAAAPRGQPRQRREPGAPQGRQPHLDRRERLADLRRGRRGDPARHRLRHDRAPPARGAAAAVAEDGGRRPAGRRHRARLQQPADRRVRLQRAARCRSCPRATRAARAPRRSARPAAARPR